MNKEIDYLKEHLYEIYKYKKSMKDLTYDMPLELLSRCCIAFDYLQQELQRKDNNWNELKKYVESKIDNVKYNSFDEVLDKIKELEENK